MKENLCRNAAQASLSIKIGIAIKFVYKADMRRLVNTLQARECRHRRRDGASERAPSSKNLSFSTV